MNITEAVNMILERYPDQGYDAFIDLNKIKDDDLQEAVRFIASMRGPHHVELSHAQRVERENFKKMIEKGYTYRTIARETGLAERTVKRKVSDYGFRKLYRQTRPHGIRAGVPIICVNIYTGEQKVIESIGKAERAFNFTRGYLGAKTEGRRFYVHGGWVFRRAN